MVIRINDSWTNCKEFIESIPNRFDSPAAETLSSGRNIVRRFTLDDGRKVVVKKYVRMTAANRLLYSTVRHTKARRAYDHAVRLLSLGIATPTPVAYIEIYRAGILRDSYFISEDRPDALCSELFAGDMSEELKPLLSELVDFLVFVHDRGVLHDDLNASNIMWRKGCHGSEFALIDINRMKFKRRLSMRRRLVNLRKLSCPVLIYLYITGLYGQRVTRDDRHYTILTAGFYRVLFERRRDANHRFKECVRRLLPHRSK